MKKLFVYISISSLLLLPMSATAQTQECEPKIGWVPLCSKRAQGNAVDADVLEGKTFSNKTDVNIPGSMKNNGAITFNPGTADQVVPAGFHNGFGTVKGDADLVTGNIKAGVTVFGVSGKTEVVDTTSGNAVAGEIFSGKKAWVDGSEITGSMTNVGTQNVTPGTSNVTITQGYHSGSGQVSGDADLVTGNVRAGVDIFGVAGNSNVVNTSSGDATSADIRFGKKAWVDGSEVTGYRTGGTPVNPAATYSPLKRWADNGNGTITDTTTGLIWYHQGNILWGTYAQCSANISIMSQGTPGDLVDGSAVFNWRLPTVNEMLTLTSGTEAISPSTPYLFSGIQTAWYWTSSASTNPVPLKFMKVQMPETNGFGVEESILTNEGTDVTDPNPFDPYVYTISQTYHYAMAVRSP